MRDPAALALSPLRDRLAHVSCSKRARKHQASEQVFFRIVQAGDEKKISLSIGETLSHLVDDALQIFSAVVCHVVPRNGHHV